MKSENGLVVMSLRCFSRIHKILLYCTSMNMSGKIVLETFPTNIVAMTLVYSPLTSIGKKNTTRKDFYNPSYNWFSFSFRVNRKKYHKTVENALCKPGFIYNIGDHGYLCGKKISKNCLYFLSYLFLNFLYLVYLICPAISICFINAILSGIHLETRQGIQFSNTLKSIIPEQ